MATLFTTPTSVQLRRDHRAPAPINLVCAAHRWSPFEAACHLWGLISGEIDASTGTATVIWPADAPDPDGHFSDWLDPSRNPAGELLELTRIIARNANEIGEHCLAPREIVAWAIGHKIVGPRSELARHFGLNQEDANLDPQSATRDQLVVPDDGAERLKAELDAAVGEIERLKAELVEQRRKAKDTGKHHAELRARCFAAALHRLAHEVAIHHETLRETPASDSDTATPMALLSPRGRVVASRLAGLVDDNRRFYGFPGDDRTPARSTIEDQIAGALNDDQWKKGL